MAPIRWDSIYFLDSMADYPAARFDDPIWHILCTSGGMSFIYRDWDYAIEEGDYVILPTGAQAYDFYETPDFRALVMCLSESFVTAMAIHSNYGIVGHMSLLQNPVMHLTKHDFDICLEGMLFIRKRLSEMGHAFREEMLGHLLLAHILDLYDIHARMRPFVRVTERCADQLRRFIALLNAGEYVQHRDLGHYAEALCVTPHYLSEMCRELCGRPASYWIDRFTLHHIVRLLRQKELPLTEIAERLHFSSLSYFSRYVQKRVGVSPSKYRARLLSEG